VARLKDAAGKRAVLIGKLEGQVAKSAQAAKLARSRAEVAEGRLQQQTSMVELMGRDAVAHEEALEHSKR
jgi:hypothetical protein